MADVRIDADDLLLTDLAQMWAADRDGVARPAPPSDPAAALALAEAHDRAGDRFGVDPAVAIFHWQRAAECRDAAEAGGEGRG